MLTNTLTLIVLLVSFVLTLLLSILVYSKTQKSQLRTSFLFTLLCLLICYIGQLSQLLFADKLGINPVYFDYFVYIGTCFLPIGIFFTSQIFAKTKISFKRLHLILFIVPILSLLILWTNDFHHLFYIKYSTVISETIFGNYFNIHTIYSYLLLIIGLVYLIKFSIKNAGFFTKQSILLIIGCTIPILTNLLAYLGIISANIYLTPISFTIAILFFALAIFKFDFLTTTPIALQKIVDRMSDGYIVLDENNKITDFNKTFITLFKCKNTNIRNENIFNIIKNSQHINLDTDKLHEVLSIVRKTINTQSYEEPVTSLKKYFRIEISSLNNKKSFLGTLILFKDITQHVHDMETIQKNQESLMESERLASLGQLIGRNSTQPKNSNNVNIRCSRRIIRPCKRIRFLNRRPRSK